MTEITIIVSPAFDHRGKRRHDRFDARLQGGEEVICEATRQPLLDASRALLRRGADPTATICMVHASAPAVVTMRALIGVMGEKFVRRKPAAEPMAGSEIKSSLSARPAASCGTKAALGASHPDLLITFSPTSPAPSTRSPAPTAACPHLNQK